MADIQRQVDELTHRLNELRNRQTELTTEMFLLQKQLKRLRAEISVGVEGATPIEHTDSTEDRTHSSIQPPHARMLAQNRGNKTKQQTAGLFRWNREIEGFIGANVISKIGILVTIIGVFIGAKYAVENELISPLMRVAVGYLVASILLFIALTLKRKYEYFSSVLLGGGLAVTYIITYIAFGFYGLLPMLVAFFVMVFTTGAAVATALWYDQKVITLIGQIAAYAIPFLLGNRSGNVFGLFAYISVINIGLLVLSFKKDWKILYYIAFFLTSLIYLFWLSAGSPTKKNFSAGLAFLTLNFFTFYVTFLSYKVFRREQYQVGEIGVLLLNALLYFFFGFYLIEKTLGNSHFTTWFTISNSFIHFVVGYFVYTLKLTDKTVFQFITGLGILFVTVAVPIELDGSWVTLLWAVEATTLSYIASLNRRAVYLEISSPLVIISVLSLFHDWLQSYPYLSSDEITLLYTVPFANVNFSLSLFVSACLGYTSYGGVTKSFPGQKHITSNFFNTIVPIVFLFILYFVFYSEIHLAWDKSLALYRDHRNMVTNRTLLVFQSLTLIIFSCLYAALCLFITRLFNREKILYLLLLLSMVLLAVFLTRGLYLIGELREIYLSKSSSITLGSLLAFRYLAITTLAIFWFCALNSIRNYYNSAYSFKVATSSLFNLTLLTIISNEFIHWMDLAGHQNQYKIGLSLICGIYSLALVFVGILNNRKHLRVFAMVLFAVTLFKLFFYDLSSLSTISKTVVLVLLGMLLLFASFLYNKYKHLLSNSDGGS